MRALASRDLQHTQVQKALGVLVNHTISREVADALETTGDFAHSGLIGDIAYLLDHGIKVALIHGDRDYACDWPSGEKFSLKIDHGVSNELRSAGHTRIVTNNSYIGDYIRAINKDAATDKIAPSDKYSTRGLYRPGILRTRYCQQVNLFAISRKRRILAPRSNGPSS